MTAVARPANKKGVALTGAMVAAIVAALVSFTPQWEGMDKVARRDAIGTGHPVTYCYGQTDEFGTVHIGQRFTKVECDAKLAESLPRYVAQVAKCATHVFPVKVWAALVDAAYNAGPAAVCRSQMMTHINAGRYEQGCRAFEGWYVRSAGVVRKGLIARRSGVPGDVRKSERDLCLEGVREG